ncbi:MAG: hypothetical protein HN658_06345, partial [Rhodospirillales bacterium]|nr:hypothetical protein [Rhodospirillales bacterium]
DHFGLILCIDAEMPKTPDFEGLIHQDPAYIKLAVLIRRRALRCHYAIPQDG